MEFILDFILHIDQYMISIVQDYHTWAYVILFIIIFCETGLVVTPFLPGDSLLFVAGAISALPGMPIDIHILVLILFAAAVLGDSCNYMIGHFFGRKLFHNPNSRIFKQNVILIKIAEFYKKYGGKTIILCPLCAYRPHFCSICSRNGKNALLLFYDLQFDRWSHMGSFILLCRLLLWRSAVRTGKS